MNRVSEQFGSESPYDSESIQLPNKRFDNVVAAFSRITGYVVFVVTFLALLAIIFR